jgi:hypothetical protein
MLCILAIGCDFLVARRAGDHIVLDVLVHCFAPYGSAVMFLPPALASGNRLFFSFAERGSS